jgi:hypothetical protein
MALIQLGLAATQEELDQLLGTRPGIGTPFSRIQQLKNVNVQVMEWCGLEKVANALAQKTAVITAIMTTPGLTGWQNMRTQHAVLVREVEATQVVYHDPALPGGPAAILNVNVASATGGMTRNGPGPGEPASLRAISPHFGGKERDRREATPFSMPRLSARRSRPYPSHFYI